MRAGDTIAAACTAPGRSARAAIRVSGPGVDAVVAALLDAPLPPRAATPARLALGNAALPVLALRFEPGRSYTGEDTLELLLPGNPALVARVLAALCSIDDVRPAEPGEFSARAYLNGRLTLDQAEGVAATIAAESEAQLAGARDLLRGRTGERYRAWADELARLLALVEAGIDFTDQEDVVAIEPAELRNALRVLADAMASRLGPAHDESRDDAGALAVLVGRPNAGKSTLFNALLGRARAVVSEQAGTTRDVIVESLDLARDAPGAGTLRLADLAGLDAALASDVDRAARDLALEAVERADLLVWCDPSGHFDPIDGVDPARPAIRVRTKLDLPGPRAEPDDRADLGVCALDGRRLGALRRALADATWTARAAGSLVLPRHRRAVGAAIERTRGAIDAAEPELVADELRAALDAIGELAGRVHPDDVIGRIFASFCVGK